MGSPALESLARRIRVARGEEPADLVLSGGVVVDVFTGRVEPGDVAIAGGRIAGIGPYAWDAAERVAIGGRAVLPSLIDAHMHVESTLLCPAELARLVVPRGTGAIIADPHEIGNVLGAAGVEQMLALSENLPLDIYYMAPSCVPALPWESAGAAIDADASARLLSRPRVLGLAEMMNVPGVLAADAAVLAKIEAAAARGAPVDGHAPGVTGRDLVAYAAAGVRSDHESTTAAEAEAKAALGMLVQVREGSSARNLDTMLPSLAAGRLGEWCLCTDDVHPDDLIARGHLDGLLRRVVAAGVDPAEAVRHAALVPARHYGLSDRGAVAPGYRADLLVVDDLESFRPSLVVKEGAVVARDGRMVAEPAAPEVPFRNTVHIGRLDESAFSLRPSGGRCPVVGIVPDQIITRRLERDVAPVGGRWAFDPKVDLALLACIERHRATGNVGLGLVEGFGFRQAGAIGSSVAHDSHNLIIAGTNARDMLAAAQALGACGGGFVVCRGGETAALLRLPVAGLLSPEPAEDVCRGLREVREAAAALGCALHCPFGTLSFLALPVIPELKITDRGLFDVINQRFL